MKHLFLINPRAGKYDRSQEMKTRVADVMAGRSTEWETVVTEGPGHAAQVARAAAETGEPVRIYACGGDGTLNEAVNGAAGCDNAAVTHCPMGSGNDFLRMFGAGAGAFYELERLLEGPQTPMDLIDCNGRLALNVCSVGFDARIGFGAADFKRLPLVSGSLAYKLSALHTIIQGIHRPYRVEIDGEELPGERFTLLCACNGRYYGGGFNPSPTAMPDDGALEFIVVPAVSRLTVASLIGCYARGGVGEIPRVILRRGREMRVICDQASWVNLDGEGVEGTELSISLSAKKINFFYPEGVSWVPAGNACGIKTGENERKKEIEAV